MLHQTRVGPRDIRAGQAFVRLGDVNDARSSTGERLYAMGFELSERVGLTPINVVLMMTADELLTLAAKLRELAATSPKNGSRIV